MSYYGKLLLRLSGQISVGELEGRVINQEWFQAVRYLPREFIDLLVMDPPYNLTRDFHGHPFKSRDAQPYQSWFARVAKSVTPLLSNTASVYVCADWRTSNLVFPVLDEHFKVRNRITWEREKGRGSKRNWKNNTEDIWFCTVGDDYYFDVESVKVKRRVMAPYTTEDGKPKDWTIETSGSYRLTHPSNIWTDMTVPFWSMPENTDHPTQKPEKLIAKLILASSRPGAFVFDPFLGSGTTAVAAKKLGRRFAGVEINSTYCIWALKRLAIAEQEPAIQGYSDGVFWERNTLSQQKKHGSNADWRRQESFT